MLSQQFKEKLIVCLSKYLFIEKFIFVGGRRGEAAGEFFLAGNFDI